VGAVIRRSPTRRSIAGLLDFRSIAVKSWTACFGEVVLIYGWALPRIGRLAAAIAVLSLGQAHAATPMVKFLAGTYAMTDVNGGGFHSLTITVPGILAVFSVDGGAEQFSMSDVSAPAGFFNGNNGESPYFMSDDLFTVTWSTAFWPYVTFYPLSDQGGMTIGSSLGDTGESNLLDTFAAPGSSQPFVIVGAPEPATWVTLALGFAGLAFLRLRRTPRHAAIRINDQERTRLSSRPPRRQSRPSRPQLEGDG
jgi:hypothetical protein